MARILIDCRFAKKKVGLGRYTRGLIPEFILQSDDECIVLLHKDDDGLWLPNNAKCTFTILQTGIAHYSILEQVWLPFLCLRYNVQYYFALHFNAPVLAPAKTVLVIHDLILHWYPNTESTFKKLVYKSLMYCNVHRAHKIIAVSKATKADITKVYGTKVVTKTTHITEGIENLFTQPSIEDAQAILRTLHVNTGNFYLYVGNAKEHKNVPVLIEGFLQANIPEAQLVLVTANKMLEEKYRHTSAIQFVSGVSDEQLIALYVQAKAFITASKYEGFCLPIIEARSVGTPILAANSPAITELADTDNDTILFEPTASGVANALQQSVTTTFTPSNKAIVSWQQVAKDLLSSQLFNG